MRLQLNSIAAVIALVVSTTAGAQDITKKPVTGADRKKTTAPATSAPPATDEAPPKPAEPTSPTPSMVTSPTVAPPATTAPPPGGAAVPDEPAPPTTAAGETGATPGQAQTSPGQASEITPAQTGTTPSGQPVSSEQAQASGQVTAATAADVKAGVAVFDQKGGEVGKVESVSSKGAVVSTGKARAEVPVSSLGKSDKGLVIGMTKAELEAASAKSTPPKKK
jgi:hypothetical protein